MFYPREFSTSGLKIIIIAVEHRFGCRACESNVCVCGKTVDTRGLHGFAYRRSARRQQRHRQMNDMLWSAIKRAQTSFPSSLKCEVVFTVSNSGGRPPSFTGKLISQHSRNLWIHLSPSGTTAPSQRPRSQCYSLLNYCSCSYEQAVTWRYLAQEDLQAHRDDDDKAGSF